MLTPTKVCHVCDAEKPLGEFAIRGDGYGDNRKGVCKPCHSKQKAEYQQRPEVVARRAALERARPRRRCRTGCGREPSPHDAYCVDCSLDGAETRDRDRDRLVAVSQQEYPRIDEYEATCLNGHTWSGRMSPKLAGRIRQVGARCGWCGMAVQLDPVPMGSVGVVDPQRVPRGLLFRAGVHSRHGAA